ncbi:unnamed protein product, partial [Meganyctiphanes norvegica]
WNTSRGVDAVDEGLQVYKPPKDHTRGKPTSYYLYANTIDKEIELSTLFMTTHFIGETHNECSLLLYYWLNGPDSGSLHLLLESRSGEKTEKWMVDGNHDGLWNANVIHLGHFLDMRVIIEARRGPKFVGGIALDDLFFINCDPPTKPLPPNTCEDLGRFTCSYGSCVDNDAVCDFADDCMDLSDEPYELCKSYHFRCDLEHGLCSDWTQEEDDNSNWHIMQANDYNEGLWPEDDHTTHTTQGHYLLLDTDLNGNDNRQKARLHSPVITGTTACTIRFWYHMRGEHPGKLNIYRRTSFYDGGLHKISSRKNDVGNTWIKMSLPTRNDSDPGNYQIVIEGIVGGNLTGSLALDDFSMTPGCEKASNQHLPGQESTTTPSPYCPPGTKLCDNGNCYSPVDTCNFHDDCGDGTDERECTTDCTFENDDMCNWFENDISSAHWVIGGFPAEAPGPDKDHNGTDKTHDIYSATDEGLGGRVAFLESHIFSDVSSEKCIFSFWYYVAKEEGDDKVELALYRKSAEDEANGNAPELLFAVALTGSGDKLPWKQEFIQINNGGAKRDFTLFFKAKHGWHKSHVAIDDVSFNGCEPSPGCHSDIDFQCANGECIKRQLVCDNKYDCPDKSDEYQCPNIKGNCNFDSTSWSNECNWEQMNEDDLNWKVTASSGNPAYGPAHDHTLGGNGQYIYISSNDGNLGLTAAARPKQVYPASQDICYIRYWYYMHSDNNGANPENYDIGKLRVFIQDLAGHRLMAASHTVNEQPLWIENIVRVNSPSNYSVIFEAETGASKQTYVALDDVSFTPECESGIPPPPPNSTCSEGERQCDSLDCVPEDYFCDCFKDCLDGSDEKGCDITCTTIITRPTTLTSTTTTSEHTTLSRASTTTTTINPNLCQDSEFSCGDNDFTCIPSVMLCDGVQDCPNQNDETYEKCPESPCDDGFYYCGDQFGHGCEPDIQLCNGLTQCSKYHADESLCGKCPDNYCQNQGNCSFEENKAPTCRCTSDYVGSRCERTKATDIPPPDNGGGLSSGAITGIVLGIIFMLLVGVLAISYYKKRRSFSPQREGSSWDELRNLHYVGPNLPGIPLENLSQPNVGGKDNEGFLNEYDGAGVPSSEI